MPEQPQSKIRPVPPPAITSVAPSRLAYAELDVTTNFSFLRGASHPDEYINRAAELGYRAIAITDRNTLAGVVRAHDAARQLSLKLIIGARLTLVDGPELLVWAPDRQAYAKLCRLLTLGKRRAEKANCLLYLEDFLNIQEGLLAAVVERALISSAVQLNSTKPVRFSLDPLHLLRDAMGDRLSVAASCSYGPDDVTHLQRLAEVSRQYQIPMLATNQVHYHDESRRALQDVVTCVREKCTLGEAGYRLFPNGERYLKSPAQMHRLFADYPEAIERGIEVARRCSFTLDELRYEYPDELAPQGMTPIQYLAKLAWEGAAERYPDGIPPKVRALVDRELGLIEQLKYEAYFLTVYDIVRFARWRGILCQGRGSAANSAVCYCIGITSVNPDTFDLLFERFVSAARKEPPDIDVDFEHERREEVIQYIYEKYGRERAGMTATVITYRGRSAVRDVGKALGLGLDVVDQLAKRLDWWHRGTISANQLRESGVDPADATVLRLVHLTSQLLGFPRHLSQHTGGMVMTRGPLCEMVPIENASMEDRTVIEWDKDDIDALGILKVDVLALGMLTAISKALALINTRKLATEITEATEKCESEIQNFKSDISLSAVSVISVARPKLELHTIPREDPEVYRMCSDADTIGVFQIESRAQMSMLPRLRPEKFYDLVIEVAIVRPGPIQGNMVHPYLQRRQLLREGRGGQIVYESEALRNVLAHTLGVPLFQEQAMRVVMVAANFTAEEADQLRRAMAAWRRSGSVDCFQQKIIRGMRDNGYTREFAGRVFEQIRGFGEYGFPESHAASFALLVYASAWIKRYHPAAFCAALLNSQPMGFYAPAQIIRDAIEHGVEVRPVDVNFSEWDCTLESATEITETTEKEATNLRFEISDLHSSVASVARSNWGIDGPAVRLGLRRIKGLKATHADSLVATRKRVGRFDSIHALHRATRLPVSALRRIAEADGFSSLGLSRRQALWQVMELSDEDAPLFDETSCLCASVPACLPAMPLGQEVMTDYTTTGHSLKRHPLALVREELTRRRILPARKIRDLHEGWVKVAGLVLIRQRPGTAAGIVFETIEDETGIVNLIIKPDIYERFRPAARFAGLLQADGYLQRQGQVIHIIAKRLFDLSDLLAGYQFSSRDFH
jgi:error-prone DNA polymerase